MIVRNEPNKEQQECSHENVFCTYSGADGAIYECQDCGLEWEENPDEDDKKEDGEDCGEVTFN